MFKNKRDPANSGSSLVLFLFIKSPLLLNAHSEGTEVAVIENNILAILLKYGKIRLLSDQNFNGQKFQSILFNFISLNFFNSLLIVVSSSPITSSSSDEESKQSSNGSLFFGVFNIFGWIK